MKRKVLRLLASVGAAACLLGLLILAKPAPKTEINLFSCGLLPVKEKKLWGYVNTAGETVIQPRFQKASRFDAAGRAVVWTVKSQCAMLDTSGEYVIKPGLYQELREIGLADRVAAKFGDSWGIVDLDLNWIAEPQFMTLGTVSENGLMAAQSKEGKYGYVDRNGKWVIPPQYDHALYFDESGRARVQVGDLYGAINEKGKLVIAPVFEDMTPFDSRGMAKVRTDGRYGYVNRNGKWVILPEFRITDHFGDLNVCWASKDGKNYGVIDRRGRWVVAPTYKNLRQFIGGYTLIKTNLDEYGYLHEGSLLNEKGQVVLGPIRGLGATLDGELVWFKENGKIGYMNLKGEVVIPAQYEGHLAISENPTVGTVFFCDGYAVVRQDGNYGVIDREGNWVLEPKYRYNDILRPNY